MKAFYSTRVNAGKHLETVTYTYMRNDQILYSITIMSKNREGSRRNRTQIINNSMWCLKNQIRGLEIAMETRRPVLLNKCRRLEAVVKHIKHLKNIEH